MSSLKIYSIFLGQLFLEQAVRNLFLPNQQTKKQKQIYSTAQSIVAMYYYIHFLTQITLKKKKLKKQNKKLTKKQSHTHNTYNLSFSWGIYVYLSSSRQSAIKIHSVNKSFKVSKKYLLMFFIQKLRHSSHIYAFLISLLVMASISPWYFVMKMVLTYYIYCFSNWENFSNSEFLKLVTGCSNKI